MARLPYFRRCKQIHDVVGNLSQQYIDVEVEAEFKCGLYNGNQSMVTKTFRVVGVHKEDVDDYHLYITNFHVRSSTPTRLACCTVPAEPLNCCSRAQVTVRVDEFRDREGSHRADSDPYGSADADGQQSHLPNNPRLRRSALAGVPKKRRAATFRSVAQLSLPELAAIYSYPPFDLGAFLIQVAQSNVFTPDTDRGNE